jgi:hypothetical protein
VDVEVLDSGFFYEPLILRRKRLRDEGEDSLDTQILQETVVFLFRIAAAVYGTREDGAIVERGDEGLEVLRCCRADGGSRGDRAARYCRACDCAFVVLKVDDHFEIFVRVFGDVLEKAIASIKA